jgi:hypothetical protein
MSVLLSWPGELTALALACNVSWRGGSHYGRYGVLGHSLTVPVTSREPSTLESFSRTIRNYVPSSIPIPSASPTPPRVSRPVSFGSFLTPARTNAPATRILSPPGHTLRSRGSDSSHEHRRHFSDWRDQFSADELHSTVFSLDEDAQGASAPTRYPSGDIGEEILWSRWDSLPTISGTSQRYTPLLFLPYLAQY